MENFKTRALGLKEEFLPIYSVLLKNVASVKSEQCTFFPQWGANYPFRVERCGLMVMGRACNGWHSKSQDINILFGTSGESIFNRKDQMRWVETSAGNKSGYNTNRSAFWRVTKRIAQSFYPDEWYSHVAWSNVCKVARWKGGNPSDKLYYAQLESCKKIFEAEIRLFSPKFVVMFTGKSWAIDFLMYLNDNYEPISIKQLNWDRYQCNVYYINGTFFIVTEHPQGKKEAIHAECIINFIKGIIDNDMQ